MPVFPSLDCVLGHTGAREILVPMLDLVGAFFGEPVGLNLLGVPIAEFLEAKHQKVVIHLSEFASVVYAALLLIGFRILFA